MMHLHEKKQRGAGGVQYTNKVVRNYAIPVKKKNVPPPLRQAIEGNPIEKTNKGAVLATVPNVKINHNKTCGCFGGMIADNTVGECPWLYIFIPPAIPNPAALNYTSRRGHPPAANIKNMTQARKEELRLMCRKVGWELSTEDVWSAPDEDPEEGEGVKTDWADLDTTGDSAESIALHNKMKEMRADGWHSWMIAPKGNFTRPERWEISHGEEEAAARERYNQYGRSGRYEQDTADDVVATYGSMRDADDEFSGYGRVTESTKVTLTVKQLKRLVSESVKTNESLSSMLKARKDLKYFLNRIYSYGASIIETETPYVYKVYGYDDIDQFVEMCERCRTEVIFKGRGVDDISPDGQGGDDFFKVKVTDPAAEVIDEVIRDKQLVNEDDEEETESPAAKQLYGLYNDGGNCWSRYGNSERWYWTMSWADEGETAAEFRKRLRRMGEGKAQQNYHEYVRGSYGVKVFSKWEDFERAARRVGLNPKKPTGI